MKNEPAFPIFNEQGYPGYLNLINPDDSPEELSVGMSKRFFAACMAMNGLLSRYGADGAELTIRNAYAYADEMLKQEDL